MRISLSLLSVSTLIALNACAPSPDTYSSRSDNAGFSFAGQDSQVDEQTTALTEMSRRIVIQTTIKGAGIGAVVGCGLVVVSASNGKNCIAGAAAGALGGAAIGHMVGKKQVARRIEKISASAVVRTLRKTNEQMALVQQSLPARLAAQDEALSKLDLDRALGKITPAEHAKARAGIAAERRAIAASLAQTENNASQAIMNLRTAESEGQTGLHWHIGAASNLADDASSARSSISLF